MRTLILVVALALFLFAGVSATSGDVNLNEGALIGFGLAAFVGSFLVPDRPLR